MISPETLSRVLTSAPDAIVITDVSGRILFASRQVSVLFGYEPGELVDQSLQVLLPERLRPQLLERPARSMDNRGAPPMGSRLDLLARRRDGSEFPIEINLSSVAAGLRTLVAVAIRDVTDRKQVEADLKAAREAADRANRAKSWLLATASHDLRQPLQSVSLLHGALCRVVADGAALPILMQQGQAIKSMSRLLNALLDFTQLESGAVTPHVSDFPVARILEELRSEFSSIAASKGLHLQVEHAEQSVRSDPSLLGQVLRNLVSNAIKYTPAGRVRVSCRSRHATVCIEVVDTGIGIPSEHLANIFDEFYQVRGAPPGTIRDGYGLGLSIVHRLVLLLGVELEVRSKVGRGSTFALRLPAGDPSLPRVGPRAPGPGATRPRRTSGSWKTT